MTNTNEIRINLIHSKSLTNTEIDLLKNYCKSKNIAILNIHPLHFTEVKADRTLLHKLFSVKNNKSLTIPKEISSIISDVIGFDEKMKMKKHIKRQKINPSAQNPLIDPLSFKEYYNIPSTFKGITMDGSNQTIGIIELGGGYNMSDITTYFQYHNLPVPTIINVNVDGQTENANGNSEGEVVLDIEIAGTFAPNSKIVVYFAPNSPKGFYDGLYAAINDTTNNPSVISISWGSAESNWSGNNMKSFNNLCIYAIQKNINIFVAAGDSGSSDGIQDGLPHVIFPASSPNVISCGGTTVLNLSNKKSEIVWNDHNGSASGGGYSTMFAKPSWQQNIKNNKTRARGLPDVAGNANPRTGWTIYINGSFEIVGGTSAVAPLWASITSLLNQANNGMSVGFLNPLIYEHKFMVMKNIHVGNNDTIDKKGPLRYKAISGWNPCCGLGSIAGGPLFNLFK